jgi:hypothetical protein
MVSSKPAVVVSRRNPLPSVSINETAIGTVIISKVPFGMADGIVVLPTNVEICVALPRRNHVQKAKQASVSKNEASARIARLVLTPRARLQRTQVLK